MRNIEADLRAANTAVVDQRNTAMDAEVLARVQLAESQRVAAELAKRNEVLQLDLDIALERLKSIQMRIREKRSGK